VTAQGTTKPAGREPAKDFEFSVYSWDIDFEIPATGMSAGSAEHLGTLVSEQQVQNMPNTIMLNEMIASDLELIKDIDWVRSGYYITDRLPKNWRAH